MAFTKRNVKDRLVQYPRRYQLVEVQSGIFDLIPVTGTVTEPGTAINKAYLQPIEDAISNIESGVTTVPKATDTDTVDGKHASDFLPNTINPANNNLNTLFTPGFFKGTFINYPAGLPDGQGNVIVMPYGEGANAGWTRQIFVSAHHPTLFTRACANGTWGQWGSDAPQNHQSANSTYGIGTAANYGHLKTRNDLIGTETEGVALTPAMGKYLKGLIDEKIVTGVYTGNELERTITLGFTPRIVLIKHQKDRGNASLVTDKGKAYDYDGTGYVEIVTNGFHMTAGDQGSYNGNGWVYNYFAVK